MYWLMVLMGVTACASGRVCPTESRLASEDRVTGRVEWCAKTTAGVTAMPAPGREFEKGLLTTSRPAAMTGAHGPYTHWYPDGVVESHGSYVEVGATSVPDGVWAFWYPDGTRKSVGRYDHARPVGCFAIWDEQGNQVTGIAEGGELRVEDCAPPDQALARVEARSARTRGRWGDATLHAIAQGGAFGASNMTQVNPEPAARGTVQAILRKHLGRFRVGPALGLRLSDSDGTRSYQAGVVGAIALPFPRGRFGAEIETQLGMQYLEIAVRRMNVRGVGETGMWAPLGSARLGVSFALSPSLQLVGGVGVDGAPIRDVDREVRYCSPGCGPAVIETWEVGGLAYGVDLGVRWMVR